MSRERMAVKKRPGSVRRVKRLDNARTGQRCGQGQDAARQRLAGTNQIRRDAGRLMGPQRTRSIAPVITSSAMNRTSWARVTSKICRSVSGVCIRMPPAPCTSGSMMIAGRVRCMFLQMFIEPIGIERHNVGLKQQRLESAEKHRIATDGHGSERVAVVAMLEADETLALGLAMMAPDTGRPF